MSKQGLARTKVNPIKMTVIQSQPQKKKWVARKVVAAPQQRKLPKINPKMKKEIAKVAAIKAVTAMNKASGNNISSSMAAYLDVLTNPLGRTVARIPDQSARRTLNGVDYVDGVVPTLKRSAPSLDNKLCRIFRDVLDPELVEYLENRAEDPIGFKSSKGVTICDGRLILDEKQDIGDFVEQTKGNIRSLIDPWTKVKHLRNEYDTKSGKLLKKYLYCGAGYFITYDMSIKLISYENLMPGASFPTTLTSATHTVVVQMFGNMPFASALSMDYPMYSLFYLGVNATVAEYTIIQQILFANTVTLFGNDDGPSVEQLMETLRPVGYGMSVNSTTTLTNTVTTTPVPITFTGGTVYPQDLNVALMDSSSGDFMTEVFPNLFNKKDFTNEQGCTTRINFIEDFQAIRFRTSQDWINATQNTALPVVDPFSNNVIQMGIVFIKYNTPITLTAAETQYATQLVIQSRIVLEFTVRPGSGLVGLKNIRQPNFEQLAYRYADIDLKPVVVEGHSFKRFVIGARKAIRRGQKFIKNGVNFANRLSHAGNAFL
jgi:hypothetical protein